MVVFIYFKATTCSYYSRISAGLEEKQLLSTDLRLQPTYPPSPQILFPSYGPKGK